LLLNLQCSPVLTSGCDDFSEKKSCDGDKSRFCRSTKVHIKTLFLSLSLSLPFFLTLSFFLPLALSHILVSLFLFFLSLSLSLTFSWFVSRSHTSRPLSLFFSILMIGLASNAFLTFEKIKILSLFCLWAIQEVKRFHKAVRRGKVNEVKLFIEKIDVNSLDKVSSEMRCLIVSRSLTISLAHSLPLSLSLSLPLTLSLSLSLTFSLPHYSPIIFVSLSHSLSPSHSLTPESKIKIFHSRKNF